MSTELEQFDKEIRKALKPLNNRQRRFVQIYAIGESQREAAVRAGYSKKTAYSMGHRLLKHVGVEHAVEHLRRITPWNAVSQRL